jgi:endonuclease/exonuclease/phosphatase (EEP) superfamily protein YafD
VASSQLSDYYNHRDALAGHAADHTWFPSDIRKTVFDLPAYIRRRQPKSTGKAPTVSNKRSAKIVVATNNIMALPKNPEVKATLLATPRASVLLVQEGNLREFKRVLASLPGYKVAGDLHAGKGSVNYSNFILYKPDVWDLVSQRYVKEYDGEDHISNTRYISVAVLRHKVLGIECAFYSYHAVTAGNDKKRKAMRAEGTAALRKAIRVNKRKMPVFVGGDYNTRTNVHPTAAIRTTHGIDQQYVWNGGGAKVAKDRAHTIKTRSDHDALVVDYTITTK